MKLKFKGNYWSLFGGALLHGLLNTVALMFFVIPYFFTLPYSLFCFAKYIVENTVIEE